MRSLIIFLFVFTTLTLKTNSQYLLPVQKNNSTNQFHTILQIGSGTTTITSPITLLLDLETNLTWVNCRKLSSISSLHKLPCHSSICKSLSSNVCDRDKSCLTLQQNPIHPNPLVTCRLVQGTVSIFPLIEYHFVYRPLFSFHPFTFSCATTKNLHGFDPLIDGVLSLAPGDLSLTKQLMPPSLFRKTLKFALCLPSSSGTGGRLYLGVDHYLIPPFHESLDPLPLRSIPLRGIESGQYVIDIKSINVDETHLSLNPHLLSRGAKLSTVVPYTLLHTDVYNVLSQAFTLKAKDTGISMVPPVAPFKDCYNANSTIPNVPVIVLGVPEVKWRFYGSNTMVKVNQEVMCLAFIDGGKKQEYSMVIGTHQIQDYLLEFDFGRSVLSFSDSLLAYKTSCSIKTRD